MFLISLFLLACSGDVTFNPTETDVEYIEQIVDVWQYQPRNAATDIVFVLDGSGSMDDNIANYNVHLPELLGGLDDIDSDWRATMIPTDLGNSYPILWSQADTAFANITADSDRIIDHHLGSDEAGLMAAFIFATSNNNVRLDADTFFVFISDEEDSSGIETSEWQEIMQATKVAPYISYSAAITPVTHECYWGNDYPILRYTAVSEITVDLCAAEADWSRAWEPVLNRKTQQLPVYQLTQVPDVNSIEVYLNGVFSTDWFYESDTNQLKLLTAPQFSTSIVVAYYPP